MTIAPAAVAQEKFKYSFQNPPDISSVYKETHNIEVGDMPGHIVRVSSLQTVYPNPGPAPSYAGVRVKEANTVLHSDLRNGSGVTAGYIVSTLENGDKIFMEANIMLHAAPGDDGKPTIRVTQTSVITGGTGKFKGIRGVLRATSTTDLKTASRGALTEGEYYLLD
ncbi:hypothetical protein ASC76_17975 [Rhizobacter sp. Root404]|nr:hypothetical protein ASC76_17975 [Rhizobacter sp. Root404]